MTGTKSSTSSLKMIIRDLFLIFLLQFEVASCQVKEIFGKAGDEVTLPCERTSCAGLKWAYSRDQNSPSAEVEDGRVLSSSPRSQRLSLKDDCSLLIKRVTAEDAGYFTCQQGRHNVYNLVLTVMTVKPSSPQDFDPMKDSHVVLECSLVCYPTNNCKCQEGGLRWMNERDETLPPLRTQSNHCVSFLKALAVGRESKYTCQYVLGDDVKVQVQYTAVFTEVGVGGPRDTTEVDAGGPRDTQPPPDGNTLFIIIGAAVAALMLLVLLVVVILVRRKSRRDADHDLPKLQEDNAMYANVSYNHKMEDTKHKDGSPEENSVTYATVSVKKKKTKEDDVAKTQVREKADDPVTYASVKLSTQ